MADDGRPKTSISDKGVMPDIVVASSSEDEKTGRGAQLQKAIDVIEGKTDGIAPAVLTAKADDAP